MIPNRWEVELEGDDVWWFVRDLADCVIWIQPVSLSNGYLFDAAYAMA
jgi:hypothetical protein